MTLKKIQFKPGINRDLTNYSNEGGWFECDKVRFLEGYPEKLKGWEKYTTETIEGTCRALFNWNTSFNDNLLAIGTNQKFYIEAGTNLNDVTPVRATTTAGKILFNATTASSSLAVTNSAHGALVGDFVTFTEASSLGGVITAGVLNQNYEVDAITDTNVFTITAKNTATASFVTLSAATADTGNGGPSSIGTYEINSGNGFFTFGYGWGTDDWNDGGWGAGSLEPIKLPLTSWFFDNFDNSVFANPSTNGQGALFVWDRGTSENPTTPLRTRAVKLSSISSFQGVSVTPVNVPALIGQVLISQKDRHLIVFGASAYEGGTAVEDTGTFDPLLIRFASQDEPFNFNPADNTKSAGFLRVSSGSKIIVAFRTRQEILVFTDSSLHTLQFLGTFDVFGLQELDPHISIAGAKAVTGADGKVYWMGTDKFYMYDGNVISLPCTLRDHVFNNLNFNNLAYVYAGTVQAQHEIWWFYPSLNSDKNDSYVVYNYQDHLWFYGSLDRTAWLDSSLRQYPQAVSGSAEGTLFNHEIGNDSDGSAMTSFITSSDIDISDGEKFTLIKRVIPDIDFSTSTTAAPSVLLSVTPRNFNGKVPRTEAPQSVVQASIGVYTEQVFMRARARQMGLKIESTSQGTAWKLGSTRIDGKPDGRR